MSQTGRIIGKQIKGMFFIGLGIMLILQMLGVLNMSWSTYILIFVAFGFITTGIAQLTKASRLRERDRYND